MWYNILSRRFDCTFRLRPVFSDACTRLSGDLKTSQIGHASAVAERSFECVSCLSTNLQFTVLVVGVNVTETNETKTIRQLETIMVAKKQSMPTTTS